VTAQPVHGAAFIKAVSTARVAGAVSATDPRTVGQHHAWSGSANIWLWSGRRL